MKTGECCGQAMEHLEQSEAQRDSWNRFPLPSLRRHQSRGNLGFGLLASATGRQYTSDIEQPSFWYFETTASGNMFTVYLKHMNVSVQITILRLNITLKIMVAGLSAIESLCQSSIHVSKCFQHDLWKECQEF